MAYVIELEDTQTGNVIEVEWMDKTPPTESDYADIFAEAERQMKEPKLQAPKPRETFLRQGPTERETVGRLVDKYAQGMDMKGLIEDPAFKSLPKSHQAEAMKQVNLPYQRKKFKEQAAGVGAIGAAIPLVMGAAPAAIAGAGPAAAAVAAGGAAIRKAGMKVAAAPVKAVGKKLAARHAKKATAKELIDAIKKGVISPETLAGYAKRGLVTPKVLKTAIKEGMIEQPTLLGRAGTRALLGKKAAARIGAGGGIAARDIPTALIRLYLIRMLNRLAKRQGRLGLPTGPFSEAIGPEYGIGPQQ